MESLLLTLNLKAQENVELDGFENYIYCVHLIMSQ